MDTLQAVADIIVQLGLGLAALRLAQQLKVRVDDHEGRISALESPPPRLKAA